MLSSPLGSRQTQIASPLGASGGDANPVRWLAGGISPSIVVAAYEFKADISKAAALTNKAGIAHSLLDSGVTSWDSTYGFRFVASTYLISDIYPTLNYSMFLQYANSRQVGDNSYYFGELSPAGSYLFALGHPNQFQRYYSNNGFGNSATNPQPVNGTVAISNQKGYQDGIVDVTGIATGATQAAQYPVFVGGLNNNGSILLPFFGDIYRCYIYSDNITDAQVLALHNTVI